MLTLETELKFLKGVGPRLGELLASRGLLTVEDLLYYLPFRYEDRSHVRRIRELLPGESATVVGQVRTLDFGRTRRGLQMLTMTVSDGTGTLQCAWFNAEFLRDKFQSGQMLALYGKVEKEGYRSVFRQPEFELLETAAAAAAAAPADAANPAGRPDVPAPPPALPSLKLGRIVPVYEAIGTLTSGRIRLLVARALETLPPVLPDDLPAELRQKLTLPDRRAALTQVHFPGGDIPLAQLCEARSPGHLRLIFEELFCLQTGIELKRRRSLRQPAPAMQVDAGVRERLKALLPFHPTADQKQALKEIAADLCSGRPMRRLLQGDVGSGKTIVALEAAAIAIANGYQVALMAPTQILAAQHYFYALERMPDYELLLLTGATTKGQRRQARKSPRPPQLIIGTQALVEGGFAFEKLGLVIVDEQHRFGVLQRFRLMRPRQGTDGEPAPHLLVMTATPIPRTLALSLYGDLEVSTIRHAPPGRLPVVTKIVSPQRLDDLYGFVRQQIQSGRQAYFVYPLIEESETLDLKPALLMESVLRQVFPEFHVGLLHGRLSAEEKNAVMHAFKANRIQILVSTTVIEVGVDVPNATVMVIEEAERFGIAQLHQLRGRVGRPQPKNTTGNSYCFLVRGEAGASAAGWKRLEALAKTTDGFRLAELDLQMRGPGEFFGTRQSGLPSFAVAEPLRDQAIMERARAEARDYIDQAPDLELRRLVRHIQARWQRHYGLVEVG